MPRSRPHGVCPWGRRLAVWLWLIVPAAVSAADTSQDSTGTPPPAHEVPADSAAAVRPQRGRAGLRRTLLQGAATVADPLSATGNTVDAVKWLARRRQVTVRGTPYGITGLPILYYDANQAWSYGARVQIADYSRRPYRYKITVHWVRSTEGRRNAHVRFKVPHISGSGFGVILKASDRRDVRARYYGLSNQSRYNRRYLDPSDPAFKDEEYYHYVLEEPRFSLSLLRNLFGPLTLSFDFGLERTDVAPAGAVSHYQSAEGGTPDGVVDGITGFVGATLSWDTRDDPTIPKRGAFHEWSYETSRNSVLGLLFEEIDFQRYTVTDARYWPRSRRLDIAHRTIVEALKGAVPLYAYGTIGGSQRTKGLGGADNLRGFDRQRFQDNVRVLTNTEVRYLLGSRVAYKQYLEFHGVLFVDTGQVAPGFSALDPLDQHLTGGLGLRIYWNEDFVIRADLGVSSEQLDVNLKLRNLF